MKYQCNFRILMHYKNKFILTFVKIRFYKRKFVILIEHGTQHSSFFSNMKTYKNA